MQRVFGLQLIIFRLCNSTNVYWCSRRRRMVVWMLPRACMYIYIRKQAIKLACSLLLLSLFFSHSFSLSLLNLARKNGRAHAPHFDYTIRSFNAPSAGKCYKLHQLRFIKREKKRFFWRLWWNTPALFASPHSEKTRQHSLNSQASAALAQLFCGFSFPEDFVTFHTCVAIIYYPFSPFFFSSFISVS